MKTKQPKSLPVMQTKLMVSDKQGIWSSGFSYSIYHGDIYFRMFFFAKQSVDETLVGRKGVEIEWNDGTPSHWKLEWFTLHNAKECF